MTRKAYAKIINASLIEENKEVASNKTLGRG
jgi:hypothetical protein